MSWRVSENGQWSETKMGTPQGAVVSPLIANIYFIMCTTCGSTPGDGKGDAVQL
jgi:hypothetical protein